MPKLRNYRLIPINLENKEPRGKRLARIRKERGLTQKDLADKIGITRSVIMDYERGKNHMYDEVIIRLAIILGVTADELLGLKNNKSQLNSHSLKVIKRINEIEKLPPLKQKKALENIDIILKGIKN
jgi:transcriptional regulator with XRE-family HTH domain